MASTYSDLKIELIGTGEQTGTWGTTTNDNFSIAIGEAITGSADVAFSSADVTVTLTNTNASQAARNLRLNLTGTSGGARNLILGSGCQIEKLYLINNGLADAVTVKNTSGTGIAVPAGKTMFVYNNGTNVVDAITYLSAIGTGVFDAGTVSAPSITFTGDTNTGIYSPAADTIAFTEGGVESMRITSAGDVGIGTSSPSYRLDVSTTGATLFRFTNSNNSTGLIGYASGSGNSYIGDLTLANTSNSAINFNSTSSFVGIFTANAERMRIDSSGNVGIGVTPATTSAGKSLQIDALGSGLISIGDTNLYLTSGINYNSGFKKSISGAPVSYYAQSSGIHTWHTFSSGTAGDAATGGEKMRITSGGDVGIGTSSPNGKVDIVSSSAGANTNTLFLTNSSGTAGTATSLVFGVGSDPTNRQAVIRGINAGGNAINLAFLTSNADVPAEQMRITSAGLVGIGESSPTHRLQVAGNSGAEVKVTRGTNDFVISLSNNAGGVIYLGSVAASPLVFQTTNTERMRIDTSGNVGIGSTATGARLGVFGSFSKNTGDENTWGIKVQDETAMAAGVGGGIVFTGNYTSGGGKASFGAIAGAKTNSTTSNGLGELRFYTTDVSSILQERMRIDSSGNLCVGTTNASAKLTVQEAANQPAGDFYTAGGASGTPCMYVKKQPNDGSTSQVYIQFLFNNASSGNGQINGDGSGAAAFGSYSDIRLKENVINLGSQLENICALRPVEFDYKTGGHQIGFIAQEMQEVYPDVVGTSTDDMLTITGWSKTEARLVKAIQELNAKVEAQTAEIALLKSK